MPRLSQSPGWQAQVLLPAAQTSGGVQVQSRVPPHPSGPTYWQPRAAQVSRTQQLPFTQEAGAVQSAQITVLPQPSSMVPHAGGSSPQPRGVHPVEEEATDVASAPLELEAMASGAPPLPLPLDAASLPPLPERAPPAPPEQSSPAQAGSSVW